MGILLWFGLLFPVMYSSYLTAQSMLFLFTLNLAQSVSPPPHLLYLEILRMILLKIMKSGMLQKIVVIIIHVCILFLGVSVRMTDCNLFWFLL